MTLYDYNCWARDQFLTKVAELDSDQVAAPAPLSYGSILGALTHILNAESLWRVRCQDKVSPSSVPHETAVESLENLKRLWQEEEGAMRGYLTSLDEQQLDEVVAYRGLRGQTYENHLWHILIHLITPGIHHRAELAAHLATLGKPLGNFDVVIYTRQRWSGQ